ncbi:hypothetical protein [Streptomyces filamentosus]
MSHRTAGGSAASGTYGVAAGRSFSHSAVSRQPPRVAFACFSARTRMIS